MNFDCDSLRNPTSTKLLRYIEKLHDRESFQFAEARFNYYGSHGNQICKQNGSVCDMIICQDGEPIDIFNQCISPLATEYPHVPDFTTLSFCHGANKLLYQDGDKIFKSSDVKLEKNSMALTASLSGFESVGYSDTGSNLVRAVVPIIAHYSANTSIQDCLKLIQTAVRKVKYDGKYCQFSEIIGNIVKPIYINPGINVSFAADGGKFCFLDDD